MNRTFVINYNRLLKVIGLCIILFPFIQQRTYTEMNPVIGYFYRYASIAVSVIILLFAVNNRSYLKGKKYLYWMGLFCGLYILPTVIYCRQNLFYVVYHVVALFSLMLYISIEIEKNPRELMSALSFLYGMYIYLNLILWLLFPKGLYKTGSYHSAFLLGDDNAIIYVVLPGLICMVVNSLQKYNRIKLNVWIAAIASEVMLLYLWSASAMVVLFLFLFLVLAGIYFGKVKPIMMLIITSVIIVFFFVATNSPIIKDFVKPVLNKSSTFDSRIFFWSKSLELIGTRPILGSGGYFQIGRWLINSYATQFYPCHTPYLQILIDGGIVLFASFVIITVVGFRTAQKYKSSFSVCILAAGLCCMMLNYITEYSELYHFFIILTLMMNSHKFEVEEMKKRRLIKFKRIKSAF